MATKQQKPPGSSQRRFQFPGLLLSRWYIHRVNQLNHLTPRQMIGVFAMVLLVAIVVILEIRQVPNRVRFGDLKDEVSESELVANVPSASFSSLTSLTTTLTIHNRQGQPIRHIIDGNQISLKMTIDQSAQQSTRIEFHLDSEEPAIATCTIDPGQKSCETAPFSTLGWYWQEGQPRPYRQITVRGQPAAFLTLQVAPRPVVLVHGFLSSASGAWSAYTGSDGFLQSIGLRGYAVGDGQAPGVLRLGDLQQPTQRTHTIAENAQVLQQYLAGVKQQTGAEQVDLIAHSMGGLISRYYIDRVMVQRDVAQLLMVASPHGGSDCASLPTALGFYMPAALELRPSYVQRIFNPQVTRRHGVPFYLFAGNPIVEEFKAPCTGVPSDAVVELNSVATIGQPRMELPYLHTNMNRSPEVFQKFVEPLLKHEAHQFPEQPDLPSASPPATPTQFTKVLTGHVGQYYRRELTVHLNHVTIASFSLFDPTRSLRVVVRGASGKVITLDPDRHGLITINDPTSLVYMGYGFENPKPGPWKITLYSTDKTPLAGADYAITAKVVGDAVLQANVDQLAPQADQPITLTAQLKLAGQPLNQTQISAIVLQPDGTSMPLTLTGHPESHASWQPIRSGTYGIDVTAQGFTPDGELIERTTFLSFEVQPAANYSRRNVIILIVVVTVAGTAIAWQKYHRKSAN